MPHMEKVAEQISFLLCRWRGQVTGRLHTRSTLWAMADPPSPLICSSPVSPHKTHHPCPPRRAAHLASTCSCLPWHKFTFLTQTCPKDSVALVALSQLQLWGRTGGEVGRYPPLHTPPLPLLHPTVPPCCRVRLDPWHQEKGLNTTYGLTVAKPLNTRVHQACPVSQSCLVPHFYFPAIPP